MNLENQTQYLSTRKFIFISHANPEDNDAALWLVSKLSLAGYEVWSDITRMFGGEYFWDDIEDCIRNHTSKFIILVSRNSQNAQGVLDETNLAVNLERNLTLPRFVIPIRLDDLPFSEFKANIGRKNAIDFFNNWGDGLALLISGLEKDKISKNNIVSPNDISKWFNNQYLRPTKVIDKPQIIGSNWLRITNFPQDINFSRIPVSDSKANEMVKLFSSPAFLFQQYVGSFASNSDLQPDMPSWLILTHGHKIRTEDILNGTTNIFPKLNWLDGQNMISGLFRKAWDNEMQQRKMIPYKFSDYSNAWFFPLGFTQNDTVKYVDLDGKTRSKKLVGKSKRLNSYWHLAIGIQPYFSKFNRFSLKTHVIFTQDGRNPVFSKERMHVMRRSFCRNWYNERWRGLLIAYLTYLSNMQNEILLHVSPNNYVTLSSKLCDFISLKSLEEESIPYQEKQEDEIEQSLDEDDDFDYIDSIDSDFEIDDHSDSESEGNDHN